MNEKIIDEQYFPYSGVSLEDARKIRYLVKNMPVFEKGTLVQMALKNIQGIVVANGMVYKDDFNLTFNMEIEMDEDEVILYSEVTRVTGNKEFYSIDKFKLLPDNIHVKSTIEGVGTFERDIPYYSPGISLK